MLSYILLVYILTPVILALACTKYSQYRHLYLKSINDVPYKNWGAYKIS